MGAKPKPSLGADEAENATACDRSQAPARQPVTGNGELLASNAAAAFVVSVLVAAAGVFRQKGEGLVSFAEGAPSALKRLRPAVKAAKQDMLDAGCWLVATADAIERALIMPGEPPVVLVNSDVLDEAIDAFGEFCKLQTRGPATFQALIDEALRWVRPKGRA